MYCVHNQHNKYFGGHCPGQVGHFMILTSLKFFLNFQKVTKSNFSCISDDSSCIIHITYSTSNVSVIKAVQ